MTGNEIFRQALSLLNYKDANGGVDAVNDAELHRRALPLINQIYADLWHIVTDTRFEPLSSLTQQVPMEPYVLSNVMPYGVAMLIAQTDGDADNQAMYASLYNQQRSSARSGSDRVRDRLPRVFF